MQVFWCTTIFYGYHCHTIAIPTFTLFFFFLNFYIALHTQPCFVGASRGMHFKREIFGTGPCQDFYFFRDNLSHSVVYAYAVVVQLQSTAKKIYVSRQKWLKKVERDVLLERHKLLGR